MSDSLPKMNLVPSVTRKNEIIDILKNAFAKDLISIDEYEKRVGYAEKAINIDEIDLLIRDLPNDLSSNNPSDTNIHESEELHCEMANKQLSGTFLLARKIYIEASMSTITIDYRGLRTIDGIQEIALKTNMSTIILYLPENISVENRLNEQMVTFRETKSNKENEKEKSSFIRFIGDASMTTIKIKRQRRRSWIFGNKLYYK
jgi:hypothetical protein